MNALNIAFNEIDEMYKHIKESLFKSYFDTETPYSFDVCCTPDECEPYHGNKHFHILKEFNKNKRKTIFMFRTGCKHNHNSTAYEKIVMENSELRKVFYKDDTYEIGITIEENLTPPNGHIWRYSFIGSKYYIIRNGETFISKYRQDIRRFFYNLPEAKVCNNVRVYKPKAENRDSFTIQIENVEILHSIVHKSAADTYHTAYIQSCEVNGERYYMVNDLNDLKTYITEELFEKNDAFKIEFCGGKEAVIRMFLDNELVDFSKKFAWWRYLEYIDIEDDTEVFVIENYSQNFPYKEGSKLFKRSEKFPVEFQKILDKINQ